MPYRERPCAARSAQANVTQLDFTEADLNELAVDKDMWDLASAFKESARELMSRLELGGARRASATPRSPSRLPSLKSPHISSQITFLQ